MATETEDLYGIYLKIYARVVTGHAIERDDFGTVKPPAPYWEEYGDLGLMAVALAAHHAKLPNHRVYTKANFIKTISEMKG